MHGSEQCEGKEKPNTQAGKDAEGESLREQADKLRAWAPVAAAAVLCVPASSRVLYLSPPMKKKTKEKKKTEQRFSFPASSRLFCAFQIAAD